MEAAKRWPLPQGYRQGLICRRRSRAQCIAAALHSRRSVVFSDDMKSKRDRAGLSGCIDAVGPKLARTG
jgi:hypothetical protein